jgi:hypothetical protein
MPLPLMHINTNKNIRALNQFAVVPSHLSLRFSGFLVKVLLKTKYLD